MGVVTRGEPNAVTVTMFPADTVAGVGAMVNVVQGMPASVVAVTESPASVFVKPGPASKPPGVSGVTLQYGSHGSNSTPASFGHTWAAPSPRVPSPGEPVLADFTVTRALLKRGRDYERAVNLFQPYDRIQAENPRGREALRELIRQGRKTGQPSFIFVNNRFEGNAPGTIEAIVDD